MTVKEMKGEIMKNCPICHQEYPCPFEREKTALMQSWISRLQKEGGMNDVL